MSALFTGWLVNLNTHINPIIQAVTPLLGATVAVATVLNISYSLWNKIETKRKRSKRKL
jgi:hypothetical protein